MDVMTRRRSPRAIVRAMAQHPGKLAAGLPALFVAGLWGWWATQLWGLPDVGDPFDVAACDAARVPDDRNAFLHYRDATAMMTAALYKIQATYTVEASCDFTGNWSDANPAWRDFLARSGEALAAFRAGSEKPDARYDHPEGLSFRTVVTVTADLRYLGQLAVLEGSRLEAGGDMAGAWGWYRAILRSSRHCGRHGFQVERLIGAAMHDLASKALTRWASDPRVDAPLLRQALDEVIAIDAMTAPYSETLKLHYLVFVRSIDDPNTIEDLLVMKYPEIPADWCQDLPVSPATKKPIQAARVLLANDKERSLRVARLMTANWLAQVDKPPARRSKLARMDPPIYEADPDAPPASRALSPEALSKWLDSSMLASRLFRSLSKYATPIDRERDRQATLVVHLATELYRREHGAPPPSPRALVGPYLKALPEGFDAPDEPTTNRP